MPTPDFNRALSMTHAFELQISRLNSVTNINHAVDGINKSLEQLTKKLVTTIKPNTHSLTYSGNESFKELFAHSRCYVMFEAMHEQLGYYFEVDGVLLVDDKNVVAHYLTKVIINNQTLYIDAYGIFNSLEQVMDRYADTTISKIENLDPCDDNHPRYQNLKDLMIDTYDSMSNYSEDIDIEMEYGEYFNKLIVTDVLKNVLAENIKH